MMDDLKMVKNKKTQLQKVKDRMINKDMFKIYIFYNICYYMYIYIYFKFNNYHFIGVLGITI